MYLFVSIVFPSHLINHAVLSPPSTARHKRRFSIGSFQRLKKEQVNAELDKTLEADAQIVELKRQLAAKKVEIDALGKQLHKKEEIYAGENERFVLITTVFSGICYGSWRTYLYMYNSCCFS